MLQISHTFKILSFPLDSTWFFLSVNKWFLMKTDLKSWDLIKKFKIANSKMFSRDLKEANIIQYGELMLYKHFYINHNNNIY